MPTQALFLLNNPLLVESSRQFAARLLDDANGTTENRVRAAFRQALQRDPSDDSASKAERRDGGELPGRRRAELDAWATVCQALLATNEFRYLD